VGGHHDAHFTFSLGENIMASPAVALNTDKTLDCTFITTHFSMGIGRMRQVRNLEVTTTADKTQLRHQKQMINSPELDEIRSQDGYMTRHLDSVSCRYDEATRFVPNSELAKAYKAMMAYQTIRRPKLVEKFMAEYRNLEAVNFAPLAAVLGDQFDRGDYPKSEEVERGFSFYFYLRPVGKIDLQGLPDFIVAMELEKEQAKRAAAVDEWTKVMRVALAGVVDSLFNALKRDPITGKRKALKDANVENLVEFCKSFPSRNLGNDAECMKLRDQINSVLSGLSPEQIRNSERVKDHIAETLAEVKQNLGNLVIVSGRRFR
jgi:hypothetical protein